MERRWTWGGAVLLGGLALTAALEHWRAGHIQEELLAHYRQIAGDRIDSEVAAINRSLYTLDALQAFLDAVPAPVPRDFTRLAATQRRVPGVDALFVADHVSNADRASFESMWRSNYPGFAIRARTPSGQLALSPSRPEYLAITYGVFSPPAILGVGYDLGSDLSLTRRLNPANPEYAVFSSPKRGDVDQTYTLVLRWRMPKPGQQLLGMALNPQGIVDSLPEFSQLRDIWQDTTTPTQTQTLYPANDYQANPHLLTVAAREIKVGGRTWQFLERLDPLTLDEPLSANRQECWLAGSALSLVLMLLVGMRIPNPSNSPLPASIDNALLRTQLDDARQALTNARRDGIRLQTILDTAGEAVLLLDKYGHIELFNVAAERMFGYDATSVRGMDVSLLLTPSYRTRVKETFQPSRHSQPSSQRAGTRDLLALRRDGAAFPVELSLSEFSLDDEYYFVAVLRDVTDRKRAERMLFESEYKHRSILDASHVGIYLLQDGLLRYVNPAFASSFSGTADQFIDKVRLSDLIAPAWMDALQAALDPARSNGRPSELVMQRPDGSRFYALITAKSIIYDNRQGLAGSLLDISERKAAEEAMLRAEIRNIAILEAIPDLMLQLDANGTIIDCRARNGSGEFGLSVDCVGHHYRRGLPIDFANSLDEARADGWPTRLRTFEYSMATDHGLKNFEARVTPASEGESLVMVRDITERTRIEAELIRHRDHLADLVRERTAELDTLFAASPLPTAFLSQRRFIEVNDAFVTLFGYPKEQIIGQPTSLFMSEDENSEDFFKQVYNKLASGGLTQIELRYRTAHGHTVLCEAIGKAIDPQNPLAASIWVYQDIGERRAAEKALEAAKDLAEAASRAKSEFLANMSHELRTPMHAVLSFAELGERKALSSEPHKLLHYFGRIRSSGQRLLQILNDLLDLSKLEAGKMQYEMKQVDLDALLREVTEEFSSLARHKALQFSMSLASGLPTIHADPLRIGQVLRNLVSNAIKFSPDGGLIKISAHRDEAGWIEISVEDEGVGIPHSELATIFDKFTQSSKTKTGAGGTGLGLAISREIIEAHAGRITARNRDEGGACFVVSLPVNSA